MANVGKKLTTRKNSQPLTRLAPKTKINFSISFQYFKQISYFGIGHKDTKWFSGLIERFKDFCSHNSDLLGNYSNRDTYRLHQINWEQPNIPIQRKDLNWIPSEYLENDIDYPIWQFEISKATGKIIGFFNENSNVFYVLLLDPNHNMQPSKSHGYKVDETEYGVSEIDDLEKRLSVFRNKFENCSIKSKSGHCAFFSEFPPQCGSYIYIDEELYNKYKKLIDNGTFHNKFEEFLLMEI